MVADSGSRNYHWIAHSTLTNNIFISALFLNCTMPKGKTAPKLNWIYILKDTVQMNEMNEIKYLFLILFWRRLIDWISIVKYNYSKCWKIKKITKHWRLNCEKNCWRQQFTAVHFKINLFNKTKIMKLSELKADLINC